MHNYGFIKLRGYSPMDIAHREYKCTKNKERRKRDVTRDLASTLRRERGLNLKDRWCNYRIVTRRPREPNRGPISRCHAPQRERSQIFPYPRISGYGNVGISMRLRFIVPLLPSGAVSALRKAAYTAKTSTSLRVSLCSLFSSPPHLSSSIFIPTPYLAPWNERVSSLSEARCRRCFWRARNRTRIVRMKENDRQWTKRFQKSTEWDETMGERTRMFACWNSKDFCTYVTITNGILFTHKREFVHSIDENTAQCMSINARRNE